MNDETDNARTEPKADTPASEKGGHPLIGRGIAVLGLAGKLGKSAGGAAWKGLSRISTTNKLRIAVVLSGAVTGGVVMSKISPGGKPKGGETPIAAVAQVGKNAPSLSIPNGATVPPETPPPPDFDDGPDAEETETAAVLQNPGEEEPPGLPLDRDESASMIVQNDLDPANGPPPPVIGLSPIDGAASIATEPTLPPPPIGASSLEIGSDLALQNDSPPLPVEPESAAPGLLEIPGDEVPPLLADEPTTAAPIVSSPAVAADPSPESSEAMEAAATMATAAALDGSALSVGDPEPIERTAEHEPASPVTAAVPLTADGEAGRASENPVVPDISPPLGNAEPATPNPPGILTQPVPAVTTGSAFESASDVSPLSATSAAPRSTASSSAPRTNAGTEPAALLFPEEFASAEGVNGSGRLTEISSDELFASADPTADSSPSGRSAPVVEDSLAGERLSVTHVVRKGENFWTLSRRYYGSGRYYKALWKFNDDVAETVEDLYVGTRVIIPPPEELDRRYIESSRRSSQVENSSSRPGAPRDDDATRTAGSVEPSAPDRSTSSKTRVHVTQAHETLRSIARKELGDSRRAEELLKLNADLVDGPGYLPEGLPIRIPEDRP